MGTYLGTLLQYANRKLSAGRLGHLHQANGRRQPRRTRANDQHIHFH